jgi:hypothetical protein
MNFLKLCSLRRPCQGVINGTRLEFSAVVGYSPDTNDVNTEAEEFSLLTSVAGKRLVEAERDDLACTVVIH